MGVVRGAMAGVDAATGADVCWRMFFFSGHVSLKA